MKKSSIVFLLSNEDSWPKLLAHITHIKNNPEFSGKIAVVVIGSAILSCLNSSSLIDTQKQIEHFSLNHVDFYLCINTMNRYGITINQILTPFTIATSGGVIEVTKLVDQGYQLFQM